MDQECWRAHMIADEAFKSVKKGPLCRPYGGSVFNPTHPGLTARANSFRACGAGRPAAKLITTYQVPSTKYQIRNTRYRSPHRFLLTSSRALRTGTAKLAPA